jgi:hypothetical protein
MIAESTKNDKPDAWILWCREDSSERWEILHFAEGEDEAWGRLDSGNSIGEFVALPAGEVPSSSTRPDLRLSDRGQG